MERGFAGDCHAQGCAPRNSQACRPLTHPPLSTCCLPVGVPLPQGMQIFVEELDEQQEQRPAVKKERWLDLGLHQLH